MAKPSKELQARVEEARKMLWWLICHTDTSPSLAVHLTGIDQVLSGEAPREVKR